jgi:hypothetical protein
MSEGREGIPQVNPQRSGFYMARRGIAFHYTKNI